MKNSNYIMNEYMRPETECTIVSASVSTLAANSVEDNDLDLNNNNIINDEIKPDARPCMKWDD